MASIVNQTAYGPVCQHHRSGCKLSEMPVELKYCKWVAADVSDFGLVLINGQ